MVTALITIAQVTRFNLNASVGVFRRSVAAFLNAFCSIQRHACNVLHGCICGKTSHSGARGWKTVLQDEADVRIVLSNVCLQANAVQSRFQVRF